MLLTIGSIIVGSVGAYEMWQSANEYNWIRFFVGLIYFLMGAIIFN